jgi:hypothetical protein
MFRTKNDLSVVRDSANVPSPEKKASTRTTFLLRADVAKCLTLLVFPAVAEKSRCSFAREPTT